MRKRLTELLTLLGMCVAGATAPHAAVMTTWVSQSGDSLTSVGGYTIAQYKDAQCNPEGQGVGACSTDTGDWTVAPGDSWIGGNAGANSQLWLINGPATASTAFTVPSSAVAFMMTGDYNDGLANFLVDGTAVLSNVDLHNLGNQTLIVSGLVYGTHTIAIEQLDLTGNSRGVGACADSAGSSSDNNVCDHVAFYGGAAVVPEPASLALISVGLAGLAFSRRRRS